jgi:hypothetical protein
MPITSTRWAVTAVASEISIVFPGAELHDGAGACLPSS